MKTPLESETEHRRILWREFKTYDSYRRVNKALLAFNLELVIVQDDNEVATDVYIRVLPEEEQIPNPLQN